MSQNERLSVNGRITAIATALLLSACAGMPNAEYAALLQTYDNSSVVDAPQIVQPVLNSNLPKHEVERPTPQVEKICERYRTAVQSCSIFLQGKEQSASYREWWKSCMKNKQHFATVPDACV